MEKTQVTIKRFRTEIKKNGTLFPTTVRVRKKVWWKFEVTIAEFYMARGREGQAINQAIRLAHLLELLAK